MFQEAGASVNTVLLLRDGFSDMTYLLVLKTKSPTRIGRVDVSRACLLAGKQGTEAACLFLDTAMVARYDLHPGSAIQLL